MIDKAANVSIDAATFRAHPWDGSYNLDLLRSFAVICVVFRHAAGRIPIQESSHFPFQPIGIFGVLLFFVHTCLVLMASMDRHTRKVKLPIGKFAASFWVRRAFRIYPLSIFAVCLMGALFAVPLRIVLPNVLLIQPYLGIASLPGPLWSLPFELLMYILLPGIFLYTKERGAKPVIIAWPLFFLMLLLQKKFAFIPEFVSYIPCFLPGVIAFLMPRTSRLPSLCLPPFLGGAFVIDVILYSHFRGQVAVGAPFCLALGFLLPNLRELKSKSLIWVCSRIAKYSYGIYLFHEIFFVVFMGDGQFKPLFHLALPSWLQVVFVVSLAVLASVLSFRLIEAPFVRIGGRIADSLVGASTSGSPAKGA